VIRGYLELLGLLGVIRGVRGVKNQGAITGSGDYQGGNLARQGLPRCCRFLAISEVCTNCGAADL
jgi:hypothetical protein